MDARRQESLSRTAARATGVRATETVPERVPAEADAIELLERLRQGGAPAGPG